MTGQEYPRNGSTGTTPGPFSDIPQPDRTERAVHTSRVPDPTMVEENDGAPETCPVCPHPQADHDAIFRRFCAARIAGGSGRGCVCRVAGQGGPA